MNLISVIGIGILLIVIILLIILIFLYRNKLNRIETQQSSFCMQILCEEGGEAPCFGFAQRTDPNGNIYCSNVPNQPVGVTGSLG